jgi:hypothetical protein
MLKRTAVSAAVFGAVIGLSPVVVLGTSPSDYYPDLQTVVPHHVQLVNAHQSEILRFTNGFANLGGGPLALRPDFSSPTSTDATQEIRDPSGAVVEEHDAGSYELHANHKHWHVANVALFQLRAGGPDGPVVGSTSTKVGFCLIDWYRLEGNSPTSERTFWDCAKGYQGSSVGWVDQYHQELEGQSVDLTGVANGTYYLISTVNPIGAFVESDLDNNTAWVEFELYGRGTGNRKIKITGNSPCATPAMCGIGAPNR